ncbi:hypothetical protein [Desulfolithobacter sp.]
MIRVTLYQWVDDAADAVKVQLPKGGSITKGELESQYYLFLFILIEIHGS